MISPRPIGTSPVSPPIPTQAPAQPAQKNQAAAAESTQTNQTNSTALAEEHHEAAGASHDDHGAKEAHGEHHGGVKPLVELSQTTRFNPTDLQLGLRAGIQGHFGKTGHFEAFGTGRVFGNHGQTNTGLGVGVHGEYVFGSGFLTQAHAGVERVSDGHHASLDFHSEGRAGWQFKPGETKINLGAGGGVAAHGGHGVTPFLSGGVEAEFRQNHSVRPFLKGDVQVDSHGALPQLTLGFRFR